MSGKTFVTSTALLALAAATVALPSAASAQDESRERGEQRGGNGREPALGQMQPQAEQNERRQEMQQQRVERQQQIQAQVQAQAQAQVQAQAQAQNQHGWQGRSRDGDDRPPAVSQPGTGWQGRYQGQAPVPQADPAQHDAQDHKAAHDHGYVDPQRNRTYGGRRDGYRDGQYQGQYQGQYPSYGNQGYDNRGNDYWHNQHRGNQYQDGRQQAWNNGWRRDQRYNWQGYRSQNRDIFRGGRYYAPYNGYSYRQLGIGFFLDQAFFGQNYWISDPGYYRLPPASGPYRWVRYYDDVLLVNIYTGQVVDEIHDFYW